MDDEEAANQRAEKLLRQVIGESKYRSFREKGYFAVEGSAGGHYRIYDYGISHNVIEMEGGYPGGGPAVPKTSLCAHLGAIQGRDRYGYIFHNFPPRVDHYLGQYLAITTCEREYRRHAIPGGPHQASEVIRQIERRIARGIR